MSAGDGFYTVDEIRERLSISTYAFWMYRPIGEGVLQECARLGIKQIELLQSPEQFDMADSTSMRYIGEACRSCGIEIRSYHALKTNFSDIDTEADRIARVDLCRRQIDTMLELGGVLWGSHAGPVDATVFKSHEELARHVEGTPAAIAVENFSSDGVSVEDRVAFLERIDHPQVGLVLDIGHVKNGSGENPMTLPGGPTQVLELCGSRLFHLHLHGFKDGRDHHAPLVEGDTIQWVELFQMLRAIGYSGDINFEPAGPRLNDNPVEAVAAAPEKIVGMAAQAHGDE